MIRRLTTLSIALLFTAGGVIGCQTGSSRVYRPQSKTTARAAMAGSIEYPTTKPAVDVENLTSTVNRRNGQITIRNFSNNTIIEPRVWINQIFVLRVRSIGPQDSIILNKADFFDSIGRSLRDQPANSIKQIQLQTDQNLINVQGPLLE